MSCWWPPPDASWSTVVDGPDPPPDGGPEAPAADRGSPVVDRTDPPAGADPTGGPAGSMRAWWALMRANTAAHMTYRVSFAADVAGSVLISALDFVAIAVLFSHLPSLRGWSLWEVALLYGATGTAFALADLAFGHFDELGALVRTGRLDAMLIRPMSVLWQLTASGLALRRVGSLLQALVVLGLAVSQLEVTWTPARVGWLALMPVTGVVIFSSVWVVGASSAFWTTDTTEVINVFTYGGAFAGQYPLVVFGRWLRRLLIYVVPLAFVAWFPALAVLDRPDPLGFPAWLRYAPPAVAAGSAWVAARCWRAGLARYRSTGS